jgi:enoyl-CoA hydratase/carnithine racemase
MSDWQNSDQDPEEPMATDDALVVDQDGGVLTLTNNDAPRNRMTLEYMDALEEAVRDAASDPSVRALVFTAAGDEHFSVGMDLKQLMGGAEERGGFEAVLDQRLRVLAAVEGMGKPSIATLYGYCLGGGLELPLACHFRLAASEGARIGLPELDLGTVPAWGGTARLTRCELHPVAELKSAAHELAQELAAMPPRAVAGVLNCVVGAGDAPLNEALAEERRAVLACSGTADQVEGMRAFLEKRRPVFTGE